MNESAEGATFDNIVHYVMENMRITHARAGYLVTEVLKAGIALGRIKRTPHDTYILVSKMPGPMAHRIREPRFSDNSNDEISSDDSI
ncbi:uncharacterized protein LOC143188322 [Calliopsis andreniformis]|uniref:uncharacterized protein LOC143188322 n=1 Tax=Calliopsis andreniformis TaxID=337506 RepID=UPI003FCEB626